MLVQQKYTGDPAFFTWQLSILRDNLTNNRITAIIRIKQMLIASAAHNLYVKTRSLFTKAAYLLNKVEKMPLHHFAEDGCTDRRTALAEPGRREEQI